MTFTYARYRAPRKARANMKLKSTRNENFYAYAGKCDVAAKYVALLFLYYYYSLLFRFCRIHAITAIKHDFVIHHHSLVPRGEGGVENLWLRPRFLKPPLGPSEC